MKPDAKSLPLHSFFLSQIRTGDMQLPEFQRNYVWRDPDSKSLFESVINDHPVGSVLLLEVDQEAPIFAWTKLTDFITPDDRRFESPGPNRRSPRYLILDGQQRLTTLAHMALGSLKNEWYLELIPLYEAWVRGARPKDTAGLTLWMQDLDIERLVRKGTKVHDPGKAFRGARLSLPLTYLADLNEFNNNLASRRSSFERAAMEAEFRSKTIQKTDKSTAAELLREAEENRDKASFLDIALRHVMDNFFKFTLPAVIIPHTMSVSGVCKVFMKMNTAGMELGAFDLTVAKLYPKNVPLKQRFNDAVSENIGIRAVDEQKKVYLLSTVALLGGQSSKTAKLPEVITARLMNDYWEPAVQLFERACVALTRHCGAALDSGYDRNLAYASMVPTLAVVMSKYAVDDTQINSSARELRERKLRAWYFGAAVASRYSEGTDNKQKVDVSEMTEWFASAGFDVDMPAWLKEPVGPSFTRVTNGALFKALLSVLNANQPTDWYAQSQPVGLGVARTASDSHHIFPKAALRRKLTQDGYTKEQAESKLSEEFCVDSILNLTWIASDTNRDIISDRMPSEYIGQMLSHLGGGVQGRKQLENVLSRHAISPKGIDFLLADDYVSFVTERELQLKSLLRTLGRAVNLAEGALSPVAEDVDNVDR